MLLSFEMLEDTVTTKGNMNKRAKEEEEDDDDGCNDHRKDSSMISNTKLTLNQYNIHLDSDIEEPSHYREFLVLLFNATEQDHITIYINCNGGQLDSAMAIIEGLKVTKAKVRGVILGKCHSAASMISMYTHELVILDAAHSLIHTASFGNHGNTNNVKTHTDFTVKQVHEFLHTTYDGFLTPEELKTVKLGAELWLDADQIRQRMVKRNKFLLTKEKQSQPGKKVST